MALIEIEWHPEDRVLRQFAGIWFPALCGVAGGLIFWRAGSLPWAAVAWGVGAAVAAFGRIVPRAVRPLFIGLTVATFPIGWVVSHLLLGLLFYGVVTPMGLCMRALGRDPMRRRFDRKAATYWVARGRSTDKRRYFRQF